MATTPARTTEARIGLITTDLRLPGRTRQRTARPGPRLSPLFSAPRRRGSGDILPTVRVMTDPLVSIVVPSHNHAWALERCLLSLLGQSYSRLEIIVCDNLSADGTEALLEKHRSRLDVVL